MTLLKQIAKLGCMLFICSTSYLQAQDVTPKWTPEEEKELFGYCDKPDLIKQLKFSPKVAYTSLVLAVILICCTLAQKSISPTLSAISGENFSCLIRSGLSQ